MLDANNEQAASRQYRRNTELQTIDINKRIFLAPHPGMRLLKHLTRQYQIGRAQYVPQTPSM